MSTQAMTVLIGALLILSSMFVGIREAILRPTSPSYPKAPFWLRSVMFFHVLVLFGCGTSVFFSGVSAKPTDWPLIMVFMAAGSVAHSLAMLVNILRQRYSPKFWARINRLLALAECNREQSLATLEILGFTVFKPREAPTVDVLSSHR